MLLLLLLLSHFSRVRLCATPQTAGHQAPPSLGFSRQEHWSGLPFPSPMHESEKWKWSHSVVSDSSRPHGRHSLKSAVFLPPWTPNSHPAAQSASQWLQTYHGPEQSPWLMHCLQLCTERPCQGKEWGLKSSSLWPCLLNQSTGAAFSHAHKSSTMLTEVLIMTFFPL